MSKNQNRNNVTYGFPSPFVPNKEKNSDDYAKRMFRAILDSTAPYREKRLKQTTESRQYARGEQSLTQYLDELNISGNDMYVNISYNPSRILQKFEKVVVDDYQQLEEKPKAQAKSALIQERKDKAKSDLRFRMEMRDQIKGLEQMLGFPLEDPNQKVPEDEDELDLISSLNGDEKEEVLLNMMLDKVFEDNDIESLKRLFLSDTFQVNFAGYHSYTDNKGHIKIRFIASEDVMHDSSCFEDITKDATFVMSKCTMTIGEIRYMYNISPDKEEELWKLARRYRSRYDNYYTLNDKFNFDWRYKANRPYDDFTVDVYHMWKKTVKNVGYTEGTDSYGKKIFDIDTDITDVEYKSNNKKRTGVVYPETAYEGWFAGDIECPVVLEWGEAVNQIREGENKQKVECPYILWMPENRGTMTEMSAVERVIPEVQMMDSQMLQIKLALANHPPSGYAIDHEALMDIDLGNGELQPLDLESIYQQTGRLYIKKRKEDGAVDNSLPIIPITIPIQEKIQTHLTIYNLALETIRDTLGVNPNREGTANLSRVSTSNAQTAIAVSQTATYYLYRAFLKATTKLTKHVGRRILDVLSYGNPSKGYLKYLGEDNIAFIKERNSITEVENYSFTYDPQMTKEDKIKLENYINAGLSSGALTFPDALLIDSIKNIELAQKYMRYIYNKNEKQKQQREQDLLDRQAQNQEQVGVNIEKAKQDTFNVQSQLQMQEWKVKGESTTEAKILDMGQIMLQAELEGKVIPPEWQQLKQLILDNVLIKQEKSTIETEQELQVAAQQEQSQILVDQMSTAVQNGELSEEEAVQKLGQMGVA